VLLLAARWTQPPLFRRAAQKRTGRLSPPRFAVSLSCSLFPPLNLIVTDTGRGMRLYHGGAALRQSRDETRGAYGGVTPHGAACPGKRVNVCVNANLIETHRRTDFYYIFI